MRRPAYEAKIAAMRAEVMERVEFEHEARHRNDLMLSNNIDILRRRIDRALWIAVAGVLVLAAAVIYLAVTR